MKRGGDKSKDLQKFNAAVNNANQAHAVREAQIRQHWRDEQARAAAARQKAESAEDDSFETTTTHEHILFSESGATFDLAAILEQFKRELVAKAAAVVNAVQEAVQEGVNNNQINAADGQAINNAVNAVLAPQNMNNFLAPVIQPQAPRPAPSAPALADLEDLHESDNQWLKAQKTAYEKYEQQHRLKPRTAAATVNPDEVDAYTRALNVGLFMTAYNALNAGNQNTQVGRVMSFFRTNVLARTGVSTSVSQLAESIAKGSVYSHLQQLQQANHTPLPSVNLWKVFALVNQGGRRAEKDQAATQSNDFSNDGSMLDSIMNMNR